MEALAFRLEIDCYDFYGVLFIYFFLDLALGLYIFGGLFYFVFLVHQLGEIVTFIQA